MKRQIIYTLQASIFLAACGEKEGDDRSEVVTSEEFFSDEEHRADSIGVAIDETLAALSDSSSSNSSANLALMLQSGGQSIERVCEQIDQSAVVSISRNIDKQIKKENDRISFEKSISGSVDLTRTWSKANQSVNCENDSHPDISWDEDIDGTSLEVVFERSKSIQMTKLLKGKEKTKSRDMSMSSSGTRTISWNSHSVTDGQIQREKTITMESSKSLSFTDQDSDTTQQSWSLSTVEGSPLEVTVVRNEDDKSLVSKKITSGSLKSTSKSGVTNLVVYDNYLINFTENSCSAASGSITITMSSSTDVEANKTYQITIDENGDYILTDISDADNPSVIEDYEFDGCSYESFSF